MWSNGSQSGSSYFLQWKRGLRGITTESDSFLPMMLPSSWIFARIAFYPSLLWGIATESSTKRWYDRIDTHVILGALPFKSQTREVSVIFWCTTCMSWEFPLKQRGMGRVSITVTAVTVIWASSRFGHPHCQNPSDIGIPCNPNPNPNPNTYRWGDMRRGCLYH